MKYSIPIAVNLLALVIYTSLFSQVAPAIEWAKCYGGSSNEFASSIIQTTDGGFIVAGCTESTDGDISENKGWSDVWIVRLDISGNLIWEKSLGGNNPDCAFSIEQTIDGGFIIAGYSASNNGDVTGNHAYDDYWVVKLDELGNLEWEKSFGGSDFEEANSVQQTTDGGFIIAGWAGSTDGDVTGNHGHYDYWIVRLDVNGNLLWQKCLGGGKYDWANSILQTIDGGFIVAGASESTNGNVTGNHGDYDYWILKLTEDGHVMWKKSFGGSLYDWASSIRQTSDGGFVIAGISSSNDGDISGNHGCWDYEIIKLDQSGNLIWQKSLGGTNCDYAFSIAPTNDEGFIIAGESYSIDGDLSQSHGHGDYWIVRLDADGNLIWQKPFGGFFEDVAKSIQQTMDGGFIIAGYSESTNGDVIGNHGEYDSWIVKLFPESQSGNCAGLKNLSATNITSTSAQLNWTTIGTPDVLKIGYKKANDLNIYTTVPGTTSSLTISDLSPSIDYVWGIQAKCGSASSKVKKSTFTTAPLKQGKILLTEVESMNLYPNPTIGRFTIDVKVEEQSSTVAMIQITNVLDKVVYEEMKSIEYGKLHGEVTLDSKNSGGLYFVKVLSGERSYCKAIVFE